MSCFCASICTVYCLSMLDIFESVLSKFYELEELFQKNNNNKFETFYSRDL